ncbi:hypothetical protein INR75_06825 [Zunongwangia sp. SCSIO 43204]|uniref:hypothetical protein n=1 Tax=Zunongwangia sp. SCSIO 43204 TaxID=2779359 RepID=UPI001CA89F1C|nr:hypothetical protein [Zunongwangia sp. SCSIO 43204]UAB85721.1 hypothetical protein INR75_06825 [Zunongwangia sp. SCSIO 43204]
MKKLLLIFITAIFVSCGNKQSELTETRKTVLVELSKKEILNRLKSPSTAKFVDSTANILKLKSEDTLSSYRLTISVDAENTYGAMTRNKYMVIFKDQGGDSLSANNYKVTNVFD